MTVPSQRQHSQPDLCLFRTKKPMFAKAPTRRGRQRGYFRDRATRTLLGLNQDDFLQNAGLYGGKEMAEYPVPIALLREGSYDQRLLPFVPRSRGDMRPEAIDINMINRQWQVPLKSRQKLWEELQQVCSSAETLALQTKLPLPEYALYLVPRLRYCSSAEEPLEFQFQPWFDLEASYARWRRIERVIGLLEGYVNLCHLISNFETPEWHEGEPVGVHINPNDIDDQDRELAIAYAFLRVPINCPESWTIPGKYTLRNAQATLLEHKRSSGVMPLSFPSLHDLKGDDYDALEFVDVRPKYPAHRYNADGTRRTKQQRKDYDEGESSDVASDSGSDYSIDDEPGPSQTKITEVMEDIQPTSALVVAPAGPVPPATQPLDSVHLEVPSLPTAGQTPALRLDTSGTTATNPASTSVSTPTSAQTSAISSSSSANVSSPFRNEPSASRGRASRRQLRSSGYQRPARSTPRPQTDRGGWDRYFEEQRARGVSYEDDCATSARRAGPSALISRPAPDLALSRSLPQLRVVTLQPQPILLHDSASNQLVETTVLSTDFSQSAILNQALRQTQPPRTEHGSQSPRERSPSRHSSRREGSRERRREYRRRSPSPEYRRRSPPRDYRDRPPPRGSYRSHPPPPRHSHNRDEREFRRPPPPQEPARESAPSTSTASGSAWPPDVPADPSQTWGCSSPPPS